MNKVEEKLKELYSNAQSISSGLNKLISYLNNQSK